MQGLVSVWRALPMQKRLLVIGALAATVITFSMLARSATTTSMALLYAGLDPSAAGDVLTSLERMDVKSEVRGDAIYVDSGRRDAVRMALAKEGLPQQGQAGFELLESLNGFSTTSDLFDATYWRAKEGELARTILATPGVKAARVHIAQQKSSAFSRRGSAPKAVVTVTMQRGALNRAQAHAIRFLVGSAVPDLEIDQVAVIDSGRGVVLNPGTSDPVFAGHSGAAERERRMEADIIDLLSARVGPGNAKVQVAIQLNNERESISERVFDPSGRVASSKTTTEMSETSSGTSGGAVTVASNLSEGDAGGQADQSSTERTQTDETLNYELSEVRREREKFPGGVERLSVAVLVNYIEPDIDDINGDLTPRSEEELKTLQALVAQSVGLDESRGDTLTIQSLAFKKPMITGEPVTRDQLGDFINTHLMRIVQIAVLSLVTLILGLFVVKPVLSTSALPAQEPADLLIASPVPEMLEAVEEKPDAIEALKKIANEKTDETTALIKSWLDETEEAV